MNPVARKGYSLGASVYEKARPSYPSACIDLIKKTLSRTPNPKIVDLAAGTGKLTRLLQPHFQDVVAVEPVAAMRETFVKSLPSVPVLNGSATEIPMKDSSVDAVVIAQAFHWFAHQQALMEIHRVLRPGGTLFLVWNMEDDRTPWVRALRDVYEPFDGNVPQYRLGQWKQVWNEPATKNHFAVPLMHKLFEWQFKQNDAEMIWNRVHSKSYVSTLDERVKNGLSIKVEQVLKEHQVLDQQGYTDFPYVTDVFWTSKILLE